MDPTIQPVLGNTGQFVITVHPCNDEQNPKRFQTIRTISSSGAELLRGPGTRVFEAIEIDENGNSIGSSVALKDIWIDSDHTREGDIRDLLHEKADDVDRQSVEKYFLTPTYKGDVWINLNTVDDTANALMRGFNITTDSDSRFIMQRRTDPQSSESTGRQATGLTQYPEQRREYHHKTHYRVVFKEICITINHIKTLPNVIIALTEAVSGAFYYGTVHFHP